MAHHNIYRFERLFTRTLSVGDSIEFAIADQGYSYYGHVGGDHIHHPTLSNRDIFLRLGLDAHQATSLAYGHKAGGGDWPVATFQYERMLTRVALYLWAMCKKREDVELKKLDSLIDPMGALEGFFKFVKKDHLNDTEVMWSSVSILMGIDLMPMFEERKK